MESIKAIAIDYTSDDLEYYKQQHILLKEVKRSIAKAEKEFRELMIERGYAKYKKSSKFVPAKEAYTCTVNTFEMKKFLRRK